MGPQPATGWSQHMVAAVIAFCAVFTGWWMFGDPRQVLAHHAFPDRPAPWEAVNAVYFPDREDRATKLVRPRFVSMQECRNWIYREATRAGDPRLRRGDWACEIVAGDAVRISLK